MNLLIKLIKRYFEIEAIKNYLKNYVIKNYYKIGGLLLFNNEEIWEEHVEEISELMNSSLKYHLTKNVYTSKNIKLFDEEKLNNFNKYIKELSFAMEGLPALVIQFHGQEKPIYDTYIDSLLAELTNSIDKAIISINDVEVYKLLMYYSKFYEDQTLSIYMKELYEKELWEKIETSYIRLSSTWDRIGQLLSFVFFNIRKYDKDTFLSTMTQIKTNIIPMYEKLRTSDSWNKIWEYSKSENNEGLKWLLTRRNLIIHQIGLHEVNSGETFIEEEIYNSYYNHILDDTIKKKLKPLSKQEEADRLSFHLNWLINNFDAIYNVCKIGLEKIPRIK